jgi:hypothetical protein
VWPGSRANDPLHLSRQTDGRGKTTFSALVMSRKLVMNRSEPSALRIATQIVEPALGSRRSHDEGRKTAQCRLNGGKRQRAQLRLSLPECADVRERLRSRSPFVLVERDLSGVDSLLPAAQRLTHRSVLGETLDLVRARRPRRHKAPSVSSSTDSETR